MDTQDSGGGGDIASMFALTSPSAAKGLAPTAPTSKPAPALHMEEFENMSFDVDAYVKRVAAESVYASSIGEAKERLTRAATQTAEEIKNSVFRNYANIMETSREVGHLEGKMSQLRLALDEQRKLLAMFKVWSQQANTVLVASATAAAPSSTSSQAAGQQQQQQQKSTNTSLALILEQVEGCGLIISSQQPLQQLQQQLQKSGANQAASTSGRTLLYHSDLDSLHIDDYSVSHRTHAYLLNDGILIAIPQRRRANSSVMLTTTTTSSSQRLKASGAKAGAGVDFLAPSTATATSSTSSYLYKFQAFYELQDVKIINIEDSKEVRNAFQLLKFPQSLAFRCPNAHIKKEWLENIETAKRQLRALQPADDPFLSSTRDNPYSSEFSTIAEEDETDESESPSTSSSSTDLRGSSSMSSSLNLDTARGTKKGQKISEQLNKAASDVERKRIMRDLFAEFDILLAQRDFEKTVDMLLRIIAFAQTMDAAQQLVYKQKQTELIQTLRKDLAQAKERGNSKGVVKTGKRVVNSLIKLNIYDEAIDLFIDYHKYLNAETLKRIKLEESNHVYMTNVLTSFFENLKVSFYSFREQFAQLLNYCYSTYISWCDTEIEILVKKLQSQHYLGRHFDITVENCELMLAKAREFTRTHHFEVVFMVQSKLAPVLDSSVHEQLDILVDASLQRSKLGLEATASKLANDQSRQLHIDQFLRDIDHHNYLKKYFRPSDLELLTRCSSASIQFARGSLTFFYGCIRVYYQDLNFLIVEAFTKLFKAELKLYALHQAKKMEAAAAAAASTDGDGAAAGKSGGLKALNKLASKISKRDIYNNVCLIERIFEIIRTIYFEKTGMESKYFSKLAEKYAKFKEEVA